MDSIWKTDGLDLMMSPYDCIATGPASGMLEIVRNAETIASIVAMDVRADKEGLKRTINAMKSVYQPELLTRWLKAQLLERTSGAAVALAAPSTQASPGGDAFAVQGNRSTRAMTLTEDRSASAPRSGAPSAEPITSMIPSSSSWAHEW